LSEAEHYEPLAPVDVLVARGVAQADLFDDDIRGVPRTEPWDAGAYEYDPSWPPADGGAGGMGGAGGARSLKEQQAQRHDGHARDDPVDGEVALAILARRGKQLV